MVKFENLWLFERSEFQRFSNFIIAQCLVEIRTKPEVIVLNMRNYSSTKSQESCHTSGVLRPGMNSEKIILISSPFLNHSQIHLLYIFHRIFSKTDTAKQAPLLL